MGSKIFLLLGLSFAIVLLISSEVAARELAETTQKVATDGRGGYNNIGSDGYHNGGSYNNGGGNYNNGGNGYHNGGGGNYNNGGGGGNGYHNGGGGNGYHNGGGGNGYHNGGGSGNHHGGGGGGGGCYHGYCRYRCCKYAGEVVEPAKDTTTAVNP